jgi:flagellin
MSTRINTNTTAFDASVNLSKNTAAESQDIQRLSSGLRINSAADDPSGYVLSQSLQAQSGSITQATNNTNDAINVVKTAEGALTQVQSLLVNIRQTIVQAANVGTNNSTALTADAQAVSDSVASIDRIASTTQFNGKNLLDGSASSGGAAVTAGVGTASGTGGNSVSIASQATSYGAAAIASGAIGYTAATASTATATFGATPAAGTFGGNFSIEGKNVTLNGSTNTLAQVATAIQQQTGLNYAVTQAAGAVTFTSQTAGAPAGTNDFAGLTSSTAATGAPATAGTAGVNASVTVDGLTSDSVSADGKTFSFTSAANATLKGLSITTNVTATNANIGQFSATADKAVSGNNLQFQIGSNQNQTVSLSIGSTKSNTVGNYTDASGSSFKLSDLLSGGSLDLTDVTGKSQQTALAVVDQAIQDISAASEKLGSVQTNVLQSNINSLAVSQSNNDSSLSTVRDTDLAATVVDYTKNQILVQAGTSALSYANQAPQAILKLLQ